MAAISACGVGVQANLHTAAFGSAEALDPNRAKHPQASLRCRRSGPVFCLLHCKRACKSSLSFGGPPCRSPKPTIPRLLALRPTFRGWRSHRIRCRGSDFHVSENRASAGNSGWAQSAPSPRARARISVSSCPAWLAPSPAQCRLSLRCASPLLLHLARAHSLQMLAREKRGLLQAAVRLEAL